MIWIKNSGKMHKIKSTATLLLTLALIYCAIRYSKECSQGVITGISFCITTLIPSLFVFMILSSFISQSAMTDILSKPFEKIAEKALKLPKESCGVIFLSLIGGYPIGARCIESLYKTQKLTDNQAKKLSYIAVCSGPGFVINFVGATLLNSKKAGLILFMSQLIAYLTVMLFVGCFIKSDSESVVTKKQINGSFVEAVEEGCKATVNMCAMVVVFSVIVALINVILKDYPLVSNVLTATLEVTVACNTLTSKYPLYFISFIIGFGGICVHAQIFSALKSIKINKAVFFLFRIIGGITAGITTYILLVLFPLSTEVFSSVENVKPSATTSLVAIAALILTAISFLNSINKYKLIRR